MHDLRTQLHRAAERAAERAQGPGAAVTLRRARRRRRTAAGATCALILAVGAVGLVLGRDRDAPTGDPAKSLPWRPLVAKEWSASVPDERPLDPVIATAQGHRDGQPWRLVTYRSVHQPAGRAPTTDVCYILDWFAQDTPGHQLWQANGTCSPQAQATAVLAVGGPGVDSTAVIGRAPSAATKVRLELRGRPAIETVTVSPGHGIPGRFYVTFVPRRAYLERMLALDGNDVQVGEAPGQGDLDARQVGLPPTGPVTVVARDRSTPLGPLTLTIWPVRDGFCAGVTTEGGGGGSSCDLVGTWPRALDPQVGCTTTSGQGRKTITMASAYGGVRSATRTVRIEVAGKRLTVATTAAGDPFNQAFFLTDLPLSKRTMTAHFTALDRAGRPLERFERSYRCG